MSIWGKAVDGYVNERTSTGARKTRTPGDLIAFGVIAQAVAAVFLGAWASADSESPSLFYIGVVASSLGAILLLIGMIAMGVYMGLRTFRKETAGTGRKETVGSDRTLTRQFN